MLEQISLDQELKKSDYKKELDELQTLLFFLQMDARKAGLPIVIVFEGWEAAGKGRIIKTLIEKLDPRNIQVIPVHEPNIEEMYRPFMWRFWINTPAKGDIVIFDQSWYRRLLEERIEDIVPKKVWENAFTEIKQFERQLTDDGTLIIKYWLHISKKEQKKRFKKMEQDPFLSWKINKKEWKLYKKYGDYEQAAEEMFQRTSTYYASWNIVACEDLRFGTAQVLRSIYDNIASALKKMGHEISPIPEEVLKD